MKILRNILNKITKFFSRGSKEDWKIIALCFFGATIFWFFNALNKQYTARIKYPISFEFNKDSVVVVSELPDNLRLSVSGGGWDLLRKTFWFDIDPVIIELESPTETEYLSQAFLTPIVREQISQIEINEIINDTIWINIEEKISKTLPIKLDTTRLGLDPGFKISSTIELRPDSVAVIGPLSQIMAMSDTFLIRLFDENIDKDYNDDLNLENFLPRLVDVVPEEINVQFRVKKYVTGKMAVKVETVNFPSRQRWDLQDSTIVISFTAAEEEFDKLDSQEFVVVVDFRNFSKKDSTIIPSIIEYPDFIESASISSSVKLKRSR